MFCTNCGNQINDGTQICSRCGATVNAGTQTMNIPNQPKSKNCKCLPSFILGLIGSIFGIFGGLCTTMCDIIGGGNAPFILIFCGSIIGMIGACLCLSRARIGSVIELVSALMIIICAFGITGSDFMSVIALLLLFFAGLIGVIYSYIIKRK